MANSVIYGNEVVYITCKQSELNTVPVVDGQIIVFYDAPGMYYDMGTVRYQVSGSLVVNKLPDKDYARDNTMYIVISDSEEPNIYIWTGTKYIALIPEQAIKEDAPDTKHYYMRIKGDWVYDGYVYYVNDSDSASNQLTKLQLFLNSFASETTHSIEVVGSFKEYTSDITLSGSGTIVDFSKADMSLITNIMFEGFDTIVGLHISNSSFRACVNLQSCVLTNCSIFCNEGSNYSIHDCYFSFNNIGGVGIQKCKSIEISKCRFESAEVSHMYPCISISNVQSNVSELHISDNQFISCIVVTSKIVADVEVNNSDTWESLCLSASSEEFGYLMKLYGYGDIFTTTNESCYAVDVSKDNFVRLQNCIISMKCLHWITASTEILNLGILKLGDVFYLDSSKLYVGISHLDNESHNIILEVNPNIFTQYDILESTNVDSDIQSYGQPIVRVLEDGSQYSNKINTMLLHEREYIDDVTFDTLSNTDNEYGLGTMLDVYREDIIYNSSEILQKFTSASHTYVSKSGLQQLASGDKLLGDAGVEHISVAETGECSIITSIENINDIRLLMKV